MKIHEDAPRCYVGARSLLFNLHSFLEDGWKLPIFGKEICVSVHNIRKPRLFFIKRFKNFYYFYTDFSFRCIYRTTAPPNGYLVGREHIRKDQVSGGTKLELLIPVLPPR